MLRLMIVDDDELMREGFERNIPWSDHGIVVAGTASDGEEGLEKAEELRPDIVLSDIKMPFMDGLQMAEQLMKRFPGIKVVFLTGYDDFHYAKQAISIKASAYVLKYEDNAQILQAVLRTAQELEREQRLEQRIKRSQGLIENKFLSDLLSGIGNDDLAEYEAKLLGLSFASRCFCVASFRPVGGQRFTTSQDPVNAELLLFSMKNICEETLQNGQTFQAYAVNYNNRTNVLYYFPEDSDNWQQQVIASLEQVKDNMERFLKLKLLIGVGNRYSGYSGIPASHQEAIITVEMKEAHEINGIRLYEAVRNHESSHHTLLKKVTELIHEHFDDEQLSLQTISENVHLSPTYISTLFKKYKDVNFSEYLVQLRMNKARELLIHTDLKAYEISEKVGYPNSQYFSVLFKKWYGTSPSEYRQQHMAPH
jgi:two-component system response regulator YesN